PPPPGRRRARPVALGYGGLAAGIALAVPLTDPFSGTAIPAAQEHLDFFPARFVAILANSLGPLAVCVVAVRSFRRRPLGNALILVGTGIAAAGSAVAGLGVAATS